MKIITPIDINSDILSKIERVKVALADHLKQTEGEQLKDLEIIEINKRSFSTIGHLKIITPKSTRRVVMKSVNHHPINISITKKENQAVVEYNILKFLYPKFQTVEGCSVPRPLVVIPEIETYVMDFVEGDLLMNKFRFARYFTSKKSFWRLKEYYYQSGCWLRHFQKFTGMHEVGAEVLTRVIERCDYRLKLIEDLSVPKCPEHLRRTVMKILNIHYNQIKDEKIAVSGRHGDFGSWNILVGSTGVTVIDYLGYGEDPIALDIIKMLMNFEDEKKYIAYSPLRIKDLKESFLKGYGSLPFISESALVICETFHRICSVLASLSNNGGRLHHRIERKICQRSNLKWLTEEQHRKLLWPV